MQNGGLTQNQSVSSRYFCKQQMTKHLAIQLTHICHNITKGQSGPLKQAEGFKQTAQCQYEFGGQKLEMVHTYFPE